MGSLYTSPCQYYQDIFTKYINSLQIKKSNVIFKKNRILEDIKTLENSSVSQANMKLLANKKSWRLFVSKRLKDSSPEHICNGLKKGKSQHHIFVIWRKKNYVEKTMKKIQPKNGKRLVNQMEILEEVRQFYSDLFGKKDKNKQGLIPPQIAAQVTKIC